MALSDERIDALADTAFREFAADLNDDYDRALARAIEAEVHKYYKALIRKMLKALERQPDYDAVTWDAITAARARLEKAP